MGDLFAVAQTKARQNRLRLVVRAENAHQIVFERQEENRSARIALAARTAAQLVVDAARFVAFGADHEQAARRAHFLARGFDLAFDHGDALCTLGGIGHVF